MTDPWTYSETIIAPDVVPDIPGYEVESRDGSIGRIDEATHDVGSSYLIVDTGRGSLGRR
jgi:hypothetical protein